MEQTTKTFGIAKPIAILMLALLTSPSFASAEGGHDLSPLGMFLMADWVVKSVIIMLIIASVISWTIAVVKFQEIKRISKQLTMSTANCLNVNRLQELEGIDKLCSVSQLMIQAPFYELSLSPNNMPKQGIKERVATALIDVEKQQKKQLISQLGFLATVGSTAPFIGLFGTVWGIMNSFIGISESNTTDLAVVAPGIAEALFATALGLVAAIPAVMLYNIFSRKVAHVTGQLSFLSAHLNRLLSRELDLISLSSNTEKVNAA